MKNLVVADSHSQTHRQSTADNERLSDKFNLIHSIQNAAKSVPEPEPAHYNMMNELRIDTHINSRYQVFDASGQLPFSIVFGLCRRSPADTDPRPLLLEVAGSTLDVPHALAHGLLTLHEQDPEDAKQWVEIDRRRLNKVAAKEAERLSLPSPVNRTEHWRDAFTVYQCHVDVNGDLASILEPGKKYIIRLASEDLGINGGCIVIKRNSSTMMVSQAIILKQYSCLTANLLPVTRHSLS